MQVGAGGQSRAANISDQLSLRNGLSHGDNVIGHVHINGREAVQMVDADVVSRAAGLIGSHRNGARPGRVDGRSLIAGHINAVVHPGGFQDGVGTHPEGTGQLPAGHRGDPGGVGRGIIALEGKLGKILIVLRFLQFLLLTGDLLHELVL